MKQRKGWSMSCDAGVAMERLQYELCFDYNYELCSFSNLSVTSPTSQLTLKPFRRFTYVTVHSPTLLLLLLRHKLFTYVTWRSAHDIFSHALSSCFIAYKQNASLPTHISEKHKHSVLLYTSWPDRRCPVLAQCFV